MASRRRRYRARPKREIVKRPPANNEINAPEVRLVGAEGQPIGVVPLQQARTLADEAEMDLVMVAQKAVPPVVRIMDLGKYVYDQRKKQAKQKAQSKGGDTKGIRISFKISDHDRDLRIRQAIGFLEEGHRVKVEMRLRGREKGRTEMAKQKVQEFISMIPGAQAEGGTSVTFNSLSATIVRSR